MRINWRKTGKDLKKIEIPNKSWKRLEKTGKNWKRLEKVENTKQKWLRVEQFPLPLTQNKLYLMSCKFYEF